MTEQTITTENTGSGNTAEPSGIALARLALQQARLAARSKGGEARAPRRRRATTTRRDGQEPSGFAGVPAGLMADRAWELPAAGGSVLDPWPDIAAAITPHLRHHVRAVAFHSETGQLDLRPDSSAYATQLRLISTRIITAANETTGTSTVRTIRVLPPGTPPPDLPTRPASPPAPAPAAPQAPGSTPKTAPASYREAIAAHRATWNRQQHTNPEIQAAAERQLRERLREPDNRFADGRQAVAELRANVAAQQRARPSDVSHARALQRLATERAGLAIIPPAVAPERLDRTA
ncbi:DciA family protein [Streptomyces griseus]|uniref:DciA family protein n=1 Tax=Streptomyces griseus TaxID=1911 RepID=UPI003820CD34